MAFIFIGYSVMKIAMAEHDTLQAVMVFVLAWGTIFFGVLVAKQEIPQPYYSIVLVGNSIFFLGLGLWYFFVYTRKQTKKIPEKVEKLNPSISEIAKPKTPELPIIRGEILNAMIGQFPNPKNPSEKLTSFVLFLNLVNLSKTPAHFLDFELYLNAGSGYQKLRPVYGISENHTFTFGYKDRTLDIPKFGERLVQRFVQYQDRSITFGMPFRGFAWFGGDPQFYGSADKVQSYKLICEDSYNQKHEIIGWVRDFKEVYLIADLFGIKGF